VRNSPRAVAMMSSRILKPWADSCGASLLETVAADHEKSAHGIGDLDAEHAFGDFGGEARWRRRAAC